MIPFYLDILDELLLWIWFDATLIGRALKPSFDLTSNLVKIAHGSRVLITNHTGYSSLLIFQTDLGSHF